MAPSSHNGRIFLNMFLIFTTRVPEIQDFSTFRGKINFDVMVRKIGQMCGRDL